MIAKVIVSIRLKPSVLEKLTKMAENNRHWSRSLIVNNIIDCVLRSADEDTLRKLIDNYHYDTCVESLIYRRD